MAASADLQIVLRAIDHASPALRNAATAAQNLGTSARNAGPGFASMASAVAAGTVAANAFISAARGLIGVFSQAGSAAADFDQSIASMRSKLSTAEWDQYGEALQKTALRLGKDYPLSAGEAGKAIDLLVQKGVSAKAINEGWAESVVRLSSATGSDLVTAAGIAAAASDAFGISADRSGEVVNRITGAVIRGGMSITDFGFGFQASSAAVALAGGTIDDVTLGLAALARRGIEGSDAGTSLKTMYMNLIPTTKAAKETMAELGLTTADGTNRFFDATGKAKSFEEISKILATATKDLTQQQKLMALETIFGSDAIRAAAIAADLGAGEISELAGAIKSVDAGEVAKKRMDSLKGSITQFTGSAETLGIVLMGRLAPGFRTIIDTGTELLNDVLEMLETFEAAAFFEELARASQDLGRDLYDAGQSVSEFGDSIKDVPIIGAPINTFLQIVGSALTGFAALLRGDAAGAADAFGNALGQMADVISGIPGLVQPFIAKAQEIGRVIGEAAQKAAEQGAWEAFKRGLENIVSVGDIITARLGEINSTFTESARVLGLVTDPVKILTGIIRGLASGFEFATNQARMWIDGLLTGINVFTNYITGASRLGDALSALARGDFEEVKRSLFDANDAFNRGDEAAEAYRKRLAEGVANGARIMAEAVGAGTQEIAETTEENLGTADDVTAQIAENMANNITLSMNESSGITAESMSDIAAVTEANMAYAAATADTHGAQMSAELSAHGSAMNDEMIAAMVGVAGAADNGMAEAVGAIAAAADPAAAAGAAFGEAATAGVTDGTVGMSDAANSAAADTVGAVEGYTGAAYGAGSGLGSNLGSGVFDGIMSWLGQVAAAARSLVNAAIGAGNTEAEVESPSKRTRRTGVEMAKGYIEGLASLSPEMQERVRDFVGASADYVPVANEIKRVEQEIKDVRERAQTEALFRQEEMIAVESEMLRLKRDQTVAERALVPLRQDLARATREISDLERGSLPDRESLIRLDGERKAIRLQEIELEKQLIGLDRDSKAARAIQERLDKLRDQDRLLNLEADRIRTTNDLAAVGTRIRREGLDDQVRAQERVILAIKEQLDVLDAEADVFQANERVIKNATDNEIDYRRRLIEVFRAEGRPLEDRVRAGLRLIDQLEREGRISRETAAQLKKIGDEALKGKAPVGALGTALDAAGRESADASRDLDALASAEAEAARRADIAAASTDSYRASLAGLDAVDPTVTVTAPALAGVQGQVDTLKTNLLGLGATVTIPVSAAQIQTASNETALLDSRLDAVESDATVPTVNASQIVLARTEATSLDGRLDAIEGDVTTPTVSAAQIQAANNEAGALDNRLDVIESDTTTVPVVDDQIEGAAGQAQTLDQRLDAVEADATTAVVNAGQIQTATNEAVLLDNRLDAVETDTTVPAVSATQIQTATNEAVLLDGRLDAVETDATTPTVSRTQIELARIQAQNLDAELDTVEADTTTPAVNAAQIQTASNEAAFLDNRLDAVESDTTLPVVNPQQIQTATNETNLLDQKLDSLDAVHTLVLDSQVPQAVTVTTLNATNTDLNGVGDLDVGNNVQVDGDATFTDDANFTDDAVFDDSTFDDSTYDDATFDDSTHDDSTFDDATLDTINTQDINQLARGGRALAGALHLVGEQGPELFIPDTGGTVIPAAETAALLGGAYAPYAAGGLAMVAGGGGGSTVIVNLTLSGNTILGDDRKVIQELARKIQPELSRRVGVGS